MREEKAFVTLRQLRAKAYEDLADLAKIFQHRVIVDESGTWRWQRNPLIRLLLDAPPLQGIYTPTSIPTPTGVLLLPDPKPSVDLNQLWRCFHEKQFSVETLMKLYMQMGYSLGGYVEVFGQTEAAAWDLPGAKKPRTKKRYTETPIEYIRRIYAGKRLCL